MASFSFPVLSLADIAFNLNNLQIVNVTEETLARPNCDLACAVYASILTHLDPLGDNQEQAAFSGLELLEYPEYHTESIKIIHLYCKIKDIVAATGANGFSLKDILKPDPQRFVYFISSILNFIFYREDKLRLLQPIIGENCSARQEELELRHSELENELLELEAAEQQDQPVVLQLQAEVDELRQSVQSLNREQATLKTHYRNLRDVKDAELRQKISDAEFTLMEHVQENDKLKSKIVQSPEKLQKALEAKRSLLTQVQNSERSAFQDYQNLLAKNDLYEKASKKLSKYLSEMQAMQEQVNSCKSIEKEVKALKTKISDMEMVAMSLEAKRVELQGKVDDGENIVSALQKEKESKCAEADRELSIVKSETDKEIHELDLRNTRTQTTISEANKIKAQTASAVNTGEELLRQLGSKCEQLVNVYQSYSAAIDNFLLKLEDEHKQSK